MAEGVTETEGLSIEGIPFDERRRLTIEIPLWRDAITDAVDGKWDKMRVCIADHAKNAWKASELDGDQDELETAAALQILAQSL